ncbi:hypothetical protein [Paenibacillus solani]|uniref:hypothetical protein n=1 Tax=Paenibacillus solani TaxID=1705565 RepID=UPI0006C8ABAD|nr:hypothetical protein [Paenibacillus solani]
MGGIYIFIKKKSLILSLLLAIILAAACYYYFAIYNSVRDIRTYPDYKGYSTGPALFSGAELVVIGSPVKDFEDREMTIRTVENGVIMDFYTLTEIEVERVLKGPEEDASNLKVIEPIVLRQTLSGKEKLTMAGYTEMKSGSRYMIFMAKNTYGQYSVINMQAGKFNMDGTDPEDAYNESVSKQRIFSELKTLQNL